MSSLFGPFGGNSSSSQLGPTVYDQQQDVNIASIQSVIDLTALSNRVTATEQKNTVQDATLADLGNTKVGFGYFNPWKSSVDSSISTLNSQVATNTSNIALKADLTYVNNEFVPWTDYNNNKITTNNLINTKLSTATYNADRTLMASKSYVDSAIAAIPPSGGSGTIGTNLPYIASLQTEPTGVGSSLIANTSMHPNGLGKNVSLKALQAGAYMAISTDPLNPGSLIIGTTGPLREAANHYSTVINGNTNVQLILSDFNTRINTNKTKNDDQQLQIDNIYTAFNTLNGTVTNHLSSTAAHASTAITRTPTTHLTATNVEAALQQLETKAWSFTGLGTGLTTEQEAAIITLDNNGTTAAPRITNVNWNKLLSLNQDLGTGNNVTFNDLHLTGNLTLTGSVDGVDVSQMSTDYNVTRNNLLDHVSAPKVRAHDALNIGIVPQVPNLPADNVKTALELLVNRVDNLTLNSSNPFSTADVNTIYNAQSDTLGSINTTIWGYVRGLQALSTTSAPRFNNITLNYVSGNPLGIRVESVHGGATRPTFEVVNSLGNESIQAYNGDNTNPFFVVNKLGMTMATPVFNFPATLPINLDTLRNESATNLTKINNLGNRFPGGLNGTVTMAFINQQQVNNLYNMSNLLIGNTTWGFLSGVDQGISTLSIPLFRGLNLSNTSGTDLPFSITKYGSGSGRSLTYSHNTNNVSGTRTDGLKFYTKNGAQSDSDESDLALKINSREIIMYGTDQATESAEALTIYQANTGYEPSPTYKTTIMRRNGSIELYGTTRADYAFPSFSVDSSGACTVSSLYLRQPGGATIQINPGSESPFEYSVSSYIRSRKVTEQITNTNRTVNTNDNVGQNSIIITPCQLKNYSFLNVAQSNIQVSNFAGTSSSSVATGNFTSSIVNLAGCNDLRAFNNECTRSIVIGTTSGFDFINVANDCTIIGNWDTSRTARCSTYSTLIGRDNATCGKNGNTVVGQANISYNSDISTLVGYGNIIYGKGYHGNTVTDVTFNRNNSFGYLNVIGSGDVINNVQQVRDCTIIGNSNEVAYIDANTFNTVDVESGIGINIHGHNNLVHGANSLIFGNGNKCNNMQSPGRAMVFGSNFDFHTGGWDYQNTNNIPVNNRLYLGDPYGGTTCSITFAKILPTNDAFSQTYSVSLQTTRGISNGAYTLCTSTSSRRYKCEIEDLDYTDEQLATLRPVKYNRYDSDGTTPLPGNRREVGFIAEELANDFPNVVVLDNQGRPDSINYEKICVLQQVQIRKQEQKIKSIENELATLKEKLLRLTIRLGF